MKLSALLKVGGIAAAVYLLTRRKLVTELQIRLAGVTLAGNLLRPQVALTFDAFNPTKYSSTVSNITGSLFLNNSTKIADVSGNNPVVIAPNAHTLIRVQFDAVFSGLTNTILTMLNAQSKTSFQFRGNMTVDGIPSIPLILDYNG